MNKDKNAGSASSGAEALPSIPAVTSPRIPDAVAVLIDRYSEAWARYRHAQPGDKVRAGENATRARYALDASIAAAILAAVKLY